MLVGPILGLLLASRNTINEFNVRTELGETMIRHLQLEQ